MSSLTIGTDSISTIFGTALAAGSSTPTVFSSFLTVASSSPTVSVTYGYSTSTASAASSGNINYWDIGTAQDMLNAALGALVIGLVLGSISFGVVCTKALSFFRGANTEGRAVRFTVGCMVLLNIIQMIATIRAVYTSVVLDFGRLFNLVNNEWSIMIQIFFMTLTASIAQMFFASRLHAIKRNMCLTMIITFFTVFQLALAIFSVAMLYDTGYGNVVLGLNAGGTWPMIATYSMAAGINVTLAAIAYVWLQKAYVMQKQGRTTFADELEYWTIKSLFGCALISIFNAIAVAVMTPNMTWLTGTFVLGNLYTLSVLLTIGDRLPMPPITMPIARAPISEVDSTDRASMATLTNDAVLWEHIVKNQTIKASLATSQKDRDGKLPEYSIGYNINDGAV